MRILLKVKILSMYKTQKNFARLMSISEDRLSKFVKGTLSPNKKERELMSQLLATECLDEFLVNTD